MRELLVIFNSEFYWLRNQLIILQASGVDVVTERLASKKLDRKKKHKGSAAAVATIIKETGCDDDDDNERAEQLRQGGSDEQKAQILPPRRPRRAHRIRPVQVHME